VEIERVCNAAHEDVLETAAIGVPPPGGGPEQLLIVVVLKDGACDISLEDLKKIFNTSIQAKLNPLFKVGLSHFYRRNSISFALSLSAQVENIRNSIFEFSIATFSTFFYFA